MTLLALALLLVAAVLHASWNYCAKRASGGLPFVAVVSVIICALYVPVVTAYWTLRPTELRPEAWLWVAGSGVLKTGYALFLQRAYRSGDFSLTYPLARGTGPLLSTLAAIALLGERPSALALAGSAALIGGIFHLTGGARLFREDAAHLARAVRYGMGSGCFIAAYTLWDRHGVAALAIPPVLYDAGTAFTQLALLTPFALHRRAEVAVIWRDHRRWAFGMALLCPLAYVLVLTAMTFTPISYVAPAREVSILIGAFLGARLLKEEDGRRRMTAAAAIVLGAVALALG
jgi:drug/metabolite transporter (DMT)-like permease